jgi:hypothetical protein
VLQHLQEHLLLRLGQVEASTQPALARMEITAPTTQRPLSGLLAAAAVSETQQRLRQTGKTADLAEERHAEQRQTELPELGRVDKETTAARLQMTIQAAVVVQELRDLLLQAVVPVQQEALGQRRTQRGDLQRLLVRTAVERIILLAAAEAAL